MSDARTGERVKASSIIGDRGPGDLDRRVIVYDFRKPDKFSKDQIKTIAIIAEEFARSLDLAVSSLTRRNWSFRLRLVDQLTFEEFIAPLECPNLFAIFGMDPLKGDAALQLDPSLVQSILDSLMGGTGTPSEGPVREITDLERRLLEEPAKAMAVSLGKAFASTYKAAPQLLLFETNPRFVQIVPPTEMIVVVELEAKSDAAQGLVRLAIPYLTIEPIMRWLGAYWYSRLPGGSRNEAMERRVAGLKGSLEIVADAAAMSVEELRSLRKGSMVRVPDLDSGTCLLRGSRRQLLSLSVEGKLRPRSGRLSFKVLDQGSGEGQAAPGEGAAKGAIDSLKDLARGFEALGESVKGGMASLGTEIAALKSRQEDLADQVIYGSGDADAGRAEGKPFAALVPFAGETLALFLAHEAEQAAALVLSNLEPETAASVLSVMPAGLQPEVMRRLAEMGWVSNEVAATVAAVMARKLGATREAGRKLNGIERAVDILNMSTRATEKNVIESLESLAPELSEEIKRRMFVFEDITLLDAATIRAVFEESGEGDFLLGLKGVNEKYRVEIVAALGAELAPRIAAALESLGRVRLSEAEAAGLRVVSVIRRMEEEGRIFIERGPEVV